MCVCVGGGGGGSEMNLKRIVCEELCEAGCVCVWGGGGQ